MENSKLTTKRITKIAIVIILVVWMLPGIVKLIASNILEIKQDDYGVFLGTVYYRKHNSSSPTNAVRLTRIRNVDSKSFINLGSGCMKDRANVICHGHPVSTVDVDSFKVHKVGNLNSRYASDVEKVLCINNLREINLKSENLSVLSVKYAKDSESAAFNCEIFIPKDVNSLQYISGEFAKDKTAVYSGGRLIPNADPKTFVIDDPLFNYSHDENRFFKGTQEVSKVKFTEHMNLLKK